MTTYSEFEILLQSAQLTKSQFADLLHLNRNSVTNYARTGEVPDHLAVIAALMAAMRSAGLPVEETIRPLSLRGNLPRGRKFGNV